MLLGILREFVLSPLILTTAGIYYVFALATIVSFVVFYFWAASAERGSYGAGAALFASSSVFGYSNSMSVSTAC